MIGDNPCESFEPLDLPHVSTHGDEEPESLNSTIEPMSSPIPASVTRNFPHFPKVYLKTQKLDLRAIKCVSLVTHPLKNVTNVTTPKPENFTSL